MTRLPRAAAALISFGLAAASHAEPLELATEPVPFSIDAPEVRRAGDATFRGALALTSPDDRFGGLSGLTLSHDGRRLVFVTDRGSWITAAPHHDARGRLTGLADAEIGTLTGPDGRAPFGKRNRDAESVIRLDGGYAVSFERRHRIWHYPATSGPFASPPAEIPLPDELYDGPANGGIEALTALADGRLVALAEDFPTDGPYVNGWVGAPGRWQTFRWRREGLFHPAGAATLPGGDLLVLERRFTLLGGFAVRLVRIDPAALGPGATVAGREIARIGPPLIEENFEGIAARRAPDGGIRLYLIADDNFNALQRTILMQLRLAR